MDSIYDGLWVLNHSGQVIFNITSKADHGFIENCFSAVEIIAREIKQNFNVGTIALENKSLCMMKIPLRETSLYVVGIINSNTMGQEHKMISSLKKISKIILKIDESINSLTEESSLNFFDSMKSDLKNNLNQKLAAFINT